MQPRFIRLTKAIGNKLLDIAKGAAYNASIEAMTHLPPNCSVPYSPEYIADGSSEWAQTYGWPVKAEATAATHAVSAGRLDDGDVYGRPLAIVGGVVLGLSAAVFAIGRFAKTSRQQAAIDDLATHFQQQPQAAHAGVAKALNEILHPEAEGQGVHRRFAALLENPQYRSLFKDMFSVGEANRGKSLAAAMKLMTDRNVNLSLRKAHIQNGEATQRFWVQRYEEIYGAGTYPTAAV